MNRWDIIARIALVGDDDPRLREVDAILSGAVRSEPQEPRLGLKAVAIEVGRHATWLWRLRVPEVCGERLAGRRSYRLSRVLSYLQSDACRARISELAAQRKRRDAVRGAKT